MKQIKVKFRSSSVDSKEGSIYYQVIHNRLVRQIRTDYHIFTNEWDECSSEIILSESNENRRAYLLKINSLIASDLKRFNRVIDKLEQQKKPYVSNDVITMFCSSIPNDSLFDFMKNLINSYKKLGRIRISEAYNSTLNSFKKFRNDKDIGLNEIDDDLIMAYEAFLMTRHVSLNTSSFYMRNLCAVYNRAVDKGLTKQRNPFKHVYKGVDKTVKRAISLEIIKKIKALDLSSNLFLEFARNMFLFSFYTRGMSFIDIVYLKKKDLNNGILSYRRRKTGQKLFIKWEKCMQDIVNKYNTDNSDYLLPILKPSDKSEREQYINVSHRINYNLKFIGRKLGLSIPLTMYVARHSWASIAKSKDIPISVISEGMGHDSEATTRIYLASLDTAIIDRANELILRDL